MSEIKNPQEEINIDLPEDMAYGEYANLAIIGHSPTEFVLDFINIMPGINKGKVRSRIILAPQHAKRLLMALSENIQNFENQFGEIQEPGGSHNVSFPLNFNNPTGLA